MRWLSQQLENHLIKECNLKIYKTIGSYFDFDKSYMIFIYWETNKELQQITDDIKKNIKEMIINYFINNGYFPNEIKDVIVYFDSDENVQINYNGNYFYATH